MLTADQKPLLRNEMKRRRAAFAQGSPLAGDMLAEIACDALDERREWPDKDAIIAGYWPIQSEINPFPLLQIFEERGYGLALPCLVAEGEGFRMIFRRFSLGEIWSAGRSISISRPVTPMKSRRTWCFCPCWPLMNRAGGWAMAVAIMIVCWRVCAHRKM